MKSLIKIITQIVIIYIIYSIGNLLNIILKPVINIPGSLLGMIILLILLITGILKLEMVEKTGDFLLKYMGFFFVPLVVGIMETYFIIQSDFIKITFILFISCGVVMLVTCKTTDYLMMLIKRRANND